MRLTLMMSTRTAGDTGTCSSARAATLTTAITRRHYLCIDRKPSRPPPGLSVRDQKRINLQRPLRAGAVIRCNKPERSFCPNIRRISQSAIMYLMLNYINALGAIRRRQSTFFSILSQPNAGIVRKCQDKSANACNLLVRDRAVLVQRREFSAWDGCSEYRR